MARSFVPSPPDSSTLNFLLSSQASNWYGFSSSLMTQGTSDAQYYPLRSIIILKLILLLLLGMPASHYSR